MLDKSLEIQAATWSGEPVHHRWKHTWTRSTPIGSWQLSTPNPGAGHKTLICL